MGPVAFFRLASASRLRLALAFASAMVACKPQIGNHCATSTDCSQTGDRLCDISQPGGYCTIFNCEPRGSNASTKCPDEAACISFGTSASPLMGCQNDLGSTAYQRSFCMKKCKHKSDCRDGYVCRDLASDPRYQAVDVDGPTKVCTVDSPAPAPTLPDGEQGVSAGVCSNTSSSVDWDAALPEPVGAGGTTSPGGGESGGVPSGGSDSAGSDTSGAGTEGN